MRILSASRASNDARTKAAGFPHASFCQRNRIFRLLRADGVCVLRAVRSAAGTLSVMPISTLCRDRARRCVSGRRTTQPKEDRRTRLRRLVAGSGYRGHRNFGAAYLDSSATAGDDPVMRGELELPRRHHAHLRRDQESAGRLGRMRARRHDLWYLVALVDGIDDGVAGDVGRARQL
jgi:hypothetical protein